MPYYEKIQIFVYLVLTLQWQNCYHRLNTWRISDVLTVFIRLYTLSWPIEVILGIISKKPYTPQTERSMPLNQRKFQKRFAFLYWMKVIHIKELLVYLFLFHLIFSVVNVNQILLICKRNPIDYSTLIMLYKKELFTVNLTSRLWTCGVVFSLSLEI